MAIPPKRRVPTTEEISAEEKTRLASASARNAVEEGVAVVSIPIGTEEYLEERAVGVGKDGGTDYLAHCLASMPNKQTATPTATESLGQRMSYHERAMDTGTSRQNIKERRQRRAQSACEHILIVPRAAEAPPFFEEGCPGDRLALRLNQRA